MQVYSEPTILLAKRVTGEEEVPDGVVGLVRWAPAGQGGCGGYCEQSWRPQVVGRSARCSLASNCCRCMLRCARPTVACCSPPQPPTHPPLSRSGDTPDVLSHLSVRSRNMRVLFASCHDPAQLDDVAKLAGKSLAFETTAAGSVKWREVDDNEMAQHTDGEAGHSLGWDQRWASA